MKNILVIQSGGRPKGSTAQLVDSFVKGTADADSAAVLLHRRGRLCSAPRAVREVSYKGLRPADDSRG